jgi:HSP20 family protein
MLSLNRSYMPLRDAVDRLFESAFTAPWMSQWSRDGVVQWPVNVFESDEAYRVYVMLPGAKADDIQITAQPGGTLTISGHVKPSAPENARAVWSEFGEIDFRRDITLPLPFKADDATVSYGNGILELVLPKSPEARPRQIRVLNGPS